jgi:hypothetical protein
LVHTTEFRFTERSFGYLGRLYHRINDSHGR